MTRSTQTKMIVVAFLATFASRGVSAQARPNLLFILTDDHGAQAVSAYGSRVNTTPNMDRLAREGMLFSHCFVTNSLCGPSRAVILTGKYSHLNGVARNANKFDGSQVTFPKLLRKGGYQTAIVGKWHLRSDPTGFDHWEVLIGQGPYYNPPFKSAGGIRQHTGYTTEITTEKALTWLRTGRDPQKPFLLMVHHKAPHRNWQPGPKQLNNYDDVTLLEPETLFDDYSGRASPARNQSMTIASHLNDRDLKLEAPKGLTAEQRTAWDKAYAAKNADFMEAALSGKDLVRWKYQRYAKDYLRCIDAVDDGIGQLLDYLDESGLARDTVVVYSSDQGWYLGEHGWYDKRWMYEESLRTPLIVRWPRVVKSNSRDEHMVSNLDFAATFLEVAGLAPPAEMQGRSLVPLLKGSAPADWRSSFYYHYYEFPASHDVPRHYGVRTERYKLIYYYHLKEWEFFDLQEDPHELHSRYDDPTYAALVAAHKAELTRLRARYRVPEDRIPLQRKFRRAKKK